MSNTQIFMNIAILRPGSSLVPNFLFPARTKTQGNWTEHQARSGSGVVIGTRLTWTQVMADPGTPGAASVAGSSQAASQGKQPMIYICGGEVFVSR